MAQTEIDRRPRRTRAELIATLADSRAGISQDAGEFSDLVNVPKRIRSTLADAPMKKAATALVAGLVSSRLLSKKSDKTGETGSGWLHRIFPEFDLKGILATLVRSYLEPGQVDLQRLIRDRLRDYLK